MLVGKKRLSICITHHHANAPLMRMFVTDQIRQAAHAYHLQPATHRLYTVARPPAQAAPDSGKVPTFVIHHNGLDYYSFNRPRRDGWLSWPCWLTDSGRFTHKVVTRPAILAQDKESLLARTGGLTTMLRQQQK